MDMPETWSSEDDDPDPPSLAPASDLSFPIPPTPQVERWSEDRVPTRAHLEEILREEGLTPWITREAPGTRYGRHVHETDEVRILVRGRMRFGLGGAQVDLAPGDRLDIPRGTPHTAAVLSEDGVEYLCASRE